MDDTKRHVDRTSPDISASLELDILDEWSVEEDESHRHVSIVRDPSPKSVDDVHRAAWFDVVEVADMASSVILDLLDIEFEDEDVVNGVDDSGDERALDALHAVIAESIPDALTPPPRLITQEIDLADIDISAEVDVTGIQIVDVDTGEAVEELASGFYELEDDDEVRRLEGTRAKTTGLALLVDGVSSKIELTRPWPAFVKELRDEVVATTDVRVRAAYLFLFGELVRAVGGRQGAAALDLDVAQYGDVMTRPDILEKLSAQWPAPQASFFELLQRLEELDEREEGAIAAIRRSSIVRERLLDGRLSPSSRERLRALLLPPENFQALVVKAVDAHASAELTRAMQAWTGLTGYTKSDFSAACVAVVGWLLQGQRNLLEVGGDFLDRDVNARPLLLMMQREAVRAGERLHEARALKRLVGLDVHLGKRIADDVDTEARLRAETASRLLRMSMILDGLGARELAGHDVEGMSSWSVLRDAVSLDATNPLLLRRLAAHARRREEPALVEQSLVSLATICQDPQTAAVLWDRIADHARRNNAPSEMVHAYLRRALAAAPDCLPALISMGQHLIETGQASDMVNLRGGDSHDHNLGWRRAELLERTKGDPVEVLSLYRAAHDQHPDSVHLFFSVERSLARLADWRALRALYASANTTPAIGDATRGAGFRVEPYQLAVEVFLEDAAVADAPKGRGAKQEVSDAMVRYVDRPSTTTDDEDLQIDQNILWRVIAREVEVDPTRALGRLELLLQASRGKSPSWRLRALVWYAHLVEDVLGEAQRALPAYREIFDRASGSFLRRWAVRGLLRTGDASWVADHLAEGRGPTWVDDGDHASFRRRMGAELMGMSAESTRALDILEQVDSDDPTVRAEVAERATVLALRSRQWVRAIPWIFECYPASLHPALAELSRHLGAAYDDAPAALRYIDTITTSAPVDPYVILCELELAYRARDWDRVLNLIEDGLGTIAAGSIDFRAFLLEQAVIVAEWGARSDTRALVYLEDLWSLDATIGSSPIFSAAAFLRTFTRLRRDPALAEHADYVRKSFTPSVAEALLAEPLVYDAATTGEQAAQWYASRTESVPLPLKNYFEFMAATLGWMFGARDRTAVQTLADTVAHGDPTHRVGPFVLTIAYRHADMYASCERQLASLRAPGHSRPVQDWVVVRQLFHLAVTQNEPAQALQTLRNDSAFGQFTWYAVAEELFARALRDPSVVPALQARAATARGARNLALEIAEIREDSHAILQLAEDELPEAIGQAEMRAARGEVVPLARWDVQARHEELALSLAHSTDADVEHIVTYFLEVEEELFGSPWCPLRLVQGDLSRIRFNRKQQDRLRERFEALSDSPMGYEARLALARHLLRVGRRVDALRLVPQEPSTQLVSTAWSLFNIALDPYAAQERTARWGQHLWTSRLHAARAGSEPEFEYELGRHLEMTGDAEGAAAAMRRALSISPRFLPAQVAAGRLLILAQNWEALATLWEAQMRSTEDEDALARVSFRVGSLWERRLYGHPDARSHAEEAYRRVLRVRPNDLPSLDALLNLAYDAQDWRTAAEALDRLAEATRDRTLRTSYLCELAALRETHLEDLPGACAAYRAAFEIDPDSVDALLGVLRTDTDFHVSVDVVRRRLERGVTQRELRELSHYLFAMTHTRPDADLLLSEVMPRHFAWLLTRLIRAVHSKQYDEEAGHALNTYFGDEQTHYLTEAFQRAANPPGPHGPPELTALSRTIGTHPLTEGQLVRCMHFARRASDLEALGTLAAVRARRTSSDVVRAAELTWVAVSMMLREQWRDALQLVEQVLEQYPDFLPAVKTAKFAADVSKNWPAVVRWFEVEASLTPVAQIAARDRLYASEVQQQHLGDFDAALGQLRAILKSDPTHAGAFTKLREILLTRRSYDELLTAYEARIAQTQVEQPRAELLNQMGDIALNHMNNRVAAIAYLGRSLELRPRQPKRLRMLAELYEQEQQWPQALVCHRAATAFVKDRIPLARLWQHIGELYETKLTQLPNAKAAYATALKLDEDATEVLLALARVCEQLNDYDDAATLLGRLVEISRDEKVLLEARVGIARLQKRINAPPAHVLQAVRDVLLHHPAHRGSIDQARKLLNHADVSPEDFFQDLTHAVITMHGPTVLPAAYEMAVELGHIDRAYCIAAISRELGVLDATMSRQLDNHATQRRWPQREIPNDLTVGVMPIGLVAPFVELVRRGADGVREGTDHTAAQQLIKRATRLREPGNEATQLAFRWPTLFGLELKDVHVATDVPGGSYVHFDGAVRLVLDERWNTVREPTDLLATLGVQLAGWSMGIGPWTKLSLDAQQSLCIAMSSRFVRGWADAERSHLPTTIAFPRIQRWIERHGEKMAPYALEVSGRFGAPAIRQQFELLEEAQKRLACLLLDDPGRALRALDMLQPPEAGARPQWLFVLSQAAAKVRKAVGVAANAR